MNDNKGTSITITSYGVRYSIDGLAEDLKLEDVLNEILNLLIIVGYSRKSIAEIKDKLELELE